MLVLGKKELKSGRMGKSDPYLLRFYKSFLHDDGYNNVGFFGQTGENFLSSKSRSFYDLNLKNWNINNFPYITSEEKFDLIVCTRCAYFSKEPVEMLKNFRNLLVPNGKILIDWGLGDHWRFEKFKVGWLKDGEQEWAYEDKNFLWSSFWDPNFLSRDINYIQFKNACIKKNYVHQSFEKNVDLEIPVKFTIADLENNNFKILNYKSLFLWPEIPQLYMCFTICYDERL
jgi:SAM-dependent methyltransferase